MSAKKESWGYADTVVSNFAPERSQPCPYNWDFNNSWLRIQTRHATKPDSEREKFLIKDITLQRAAERFKTTHGFHRV
jgi:hypothetical protein